MSHLSSRRHGRGKKMFTLLAPNCDQIVTKLTKHVAEPILVPESRFRGIRWGNLHHFSRSIRSDRSRGSGEGSEMKIFPWCLKCQLLQRKQNRHGHIGMVFVRWQLMGPSAPRLIGVWFSFSVPLAFLFCGLRSSYDPVTSQLRPAGTSRYQLVPAGTRWS